MRVITFSRFFPSNHPRKGEPTFFVEKILITLGGENLYNPCPIQDLNQSQVLQANPKYHTIRAESKMNQHGREIISRIKRKTSKGKRAKKSYK